MIPNYEVLPLPGYLEHVFRFDGRWYGVDLAEDKLPGAVIKIWEDTPDPVWVRVDDNPRGNTAKFPKRLKWHQELRRRNAASFARLLDTIEFHGYTPARGYPEKETVFTHRGPAVEQLESVMDRTGRCTILELLFCNLYAKHELRQYRLAGIKAVPGLGDGYAYQGTLSDETTTLTLYYTRQHKLHQVSQVTLD